MGVGKSRWHVHLATDYFDIGSGFASARGLHCLVEFAKCGHRGVDDDDPDKLAWADLISAFIVGDYESAIEMADRAVALNPNFISGVERKGLGL